ncbi:MAG TPA: alpha/beta hydrolase [Bryobacteraceae bacterium]|nr:alpha/beta hydrolase [Bryobacteraceae bacterium]
MKSTIAEMQTSVSFSQGYVTTEDDVRLFFQKSGDGREAVIIPNAVHMIDSFRHLAGQRTVIFFDLRNRGGSDAVTDGARSMPGIHHDVEDIEAVRRHFGVERCSLIGHSYLGLTVILYAMRCTPQVSRVVQIGAPAARAGTEYAPELMWSDEVMARFMSKMGQLQQRGAAGDPREFCREFWDLIREIYVANPADAAKVRWTPCDFPNEYLHFMAHYMRNVVPSMQALDLTAEDFAKVTMPVLTIHGTHDRQSPYGAGREWAVKLPNARLLTVTNAAHVPWIEAPERVFGSIDTFLDGEWPEQAEEVTAV